MQIPAARAVICVRDGSGPAAVCGWRPSPLGRRAERKRATDSPTRAALCGEGHAPIMGKREIKSTGGQGNKKLDKGTIVVSHYEGTKIPFIINNL